MFFFKKIIGFCCFIWKVLPVNHFFVFVCLFVFLMKSFGEVTHHSVIFFFFETRKPEVLKMSFSLCIYVYKLMTGS